MSGRCQRGKQRVGTRPFSRAGSHLGWILRVELGVSRRFQVCFTKLRFGMVWDWQAKWRGTVRQERESFWEGDALNS